MEAGCQRLSLTGAARKGGVAQGHFPDSQAAAEASPLLQSWQVGMGATSVDEDVPDAIGTDSAHTTAQLCYSVHHPSEPRDAEGRLPPEQLLRYDIGLVCSLLAFMHIRGTAFASWRLWLHILGSLSIAAVVAVIFLLCCRQPELIDARRISEFVTYSSELVGLLLVFFLVSAVNRWWDMRAKTIGGLSGATTDLAMMLAAHLPHSGHWDLGNLVLRYCLASLELTFMQAQGADGVLEPLVKRKLLTEDEKRKLEELVSKPQAIWVWIAGIFRQLAERGKLSSRMLAALYEICARGRGSVGRGNGAFAYIDTQLPFSYAHLLSLMVHFNSFMVAIKCGILASVAIWNLSRKDTKKDPVSDAENLQVLILQVLFAIFVPAVYYALLEVAAALSDPFHDGFQDLPRLAYHNATKRQCETLHRAGERLPAEVMRVTDEFWIPDGDLVEDRVLEVV